MISKKETMFRFWELSIHILLLKNRISNIRGMKTSIFWEFSKNILLLKNRILKVQGIKTLILWEFSNTLRNQTNPSWDESIVKVPPRLDMQVFLFKISNSECNYK